MPNEKRYVLIEVYTTEEFSMPGPTTEKGSNDPRARLNINALREIAHADVVLAVEPGGQAAVVFDRSLATDARESAVVTTINARPQGMA